MLMKRRHSKIFFAFIAGVMVVFSLLYATPGHCKIAIAVAGPTTGPGAQYGKLFKMGAEAAAYEINKKGGVNGEEIVIQMYDDKNNPTEAANVAQKISTDKNVVAVAGHFTSSATHAAIPIYQRNGIPILVVTATDPSITKQGNSFVFRICLTQEVEGTAVAKWLVGKLGKKKIGAIYMNTDYGKAHFANFSKMAVALGGKIAVEERYQPGTVDFTSILIKIKDAGVEAMEIGTYYNDAALIAKQTRKMGIKVPIAVSGAAKTPGLMELGGKATEGIYSTQLPAGPRREQAVKTVKQLTGLKVIPAPDFAFTCYDAVHYIAEAVRIAGSTNRDAVRSALASIKDFPTNYGLGTFDQDRQVKYTYMEVVQVQDGRFVKVGDTR